MYTKGVYVTSMRTNDCAPFFILCKANGDLGSPFRLLPEVIDPPEKAFPPRQRVESVFDLTIDVSLAVIDIGDGFNLRYMMHVTLLYGYGSILSILHI
jgi:hypothetical protein